MRYPLTPMAKPRMSRSDKWKRRAVVVRYRAFCDEARLRKLAVPESGGHLVFHIPMPKSWPKYKREEMRGKPHQQKPDVDNLVKAVLDAVYEDDSCVWHLVAEKRWADEGAIEVREVDCS